MREPTHDDITLELIVELETFELITALLEYVKALEEMVIELRSQVNHLTLPGESMPYVDLYSDLFEIFYDYPAYERFKEAFEILDRE